MIGVGGKLGGGACSRSITDFATSAAERIVPTGSRARGLEARRGLIFLGADLRAVFARLGLGARAAFLAADLRTAGLSWRVAAGFAARAVADATAATAFRRACFAAFFLILNNLRACLSVAFASRTLVFAAAARAAARVAAALSRFMKDDWAITSRLLVGNISNRVGSTSPEAKSATVAATFNTQTGSWGSTRIKN